MDPATGGDTPNEPARTIAFATRFESHIRALEILVHLLDETTEAVEVRVGRGERIGLAEIDISNLLLGRLTDLAGEFRDLLAEVEGGR